MLYSLVTHFDLFAEFCVFFLFRRTSSRREQVDECGRLVVHRLAVALLAVLGHGTCIVLPPLLPRPHLQLDALR